MHDVQTWRINLLKQLLQQSSRTALHDYKLGLKFTGIPRELSLKSLWTHYYKVLILSLTYYHCDHDPPTAALITLAKLWYASACVNAQHVWYP